jgi:oxygen-independent coproporphyrinogen III oxidase
MDVDLVRKYNTSGPRYTSYPPVPAWSRSPAPEEWKWHVRRAALHGNDTEGISLYVHLPYCESLCTYCGCTTRITVNHAVEAPYIASVLKEWRMYRTLFQGAPRIRELHLGGGTPTFFAPDNLKRLVEGLLDGCVVAADADLGFEGHPNNTVAAHLRTLYDLGFRRVSYGIQDFDPKVQEVINRVQPFESVDRAFREARGQGYTSINADLVFGLPHQTLASMERTIDLTNALRPDRIAFYSYAHVPWIRPGQRRYTEVDLPADADKRALYESGKQRFETAGYREIGMDHFALPHDALSAAMAGGHLHRNFMGYTPVRTRLMIGLGVSAISDSWSCYAQNHKTVEDYREAVERGCLPVFRGHVLNEDDLRTRATILDVMCRMRADLSAMGWDAHDVEAHFFDLIGDGLVLQNGTVITVTDKGRPFVRNVCMAFDPHLLLQQEGTKPRYSMTV